MVAAMMTSFYDAGASTQLKDDAHERLQQAGEGGIIAEITFYLLLLHVEVVDDDADEEIQREERSEDDEEDEVEVHEHAPFVLRLLADLRNTKARASQRVVRLLQSGERIRSVRPARSSVRPAVSAPYVGPYVDQSKRLNSTSGLLSYPSVRPSVR